MDEDEIKTPADQVAQECYKTLSESVRTANTFPTGAARDMFSTYTSFHAVIDNLSGSILAVANTVITSQGIRIRLKKDADSTPQLSQVNDAILDLIHQSKTSDVHRAQASTTVIPLINRKKQNTAQKRNLHNEMKLQDKYNIKVNNSVGLWTPLITEKPNALFPFHLEAVSDAFGEIVGYINPYSVEIDQLELTALWTTTRNVVITEVLSENLHYVDNEEDLHKLCENIRNEAAIAVDLEHHSDRSYQGVTCLLQVSTETADYVVDTLKLWGKLQCLNETFTNPNCVKVFHGAFNDILWLQRDLGVYVVNLFDTHEAARVLNYSKKSLSDLVSHFCGLRLNKALQMADWTIRPLPQEFVSYARQDTHYLLFIWQKLLSELHSKRLEGAVLQACQRLSKQSYTKNPLSYDAFEKILSTNHAIKHDQTKANALRKLYKWRDECAREEDVSPNYFLSNKIITKLASTVNPNSDTVNRLTHHAYLSEKHISDIICIINEATYVQNEDKESGNSSETNSAKKVTSNDLPLSSQSAPWAKASNRRNRNSGGNKSTALNNDLQTNADIPKYVSPFQRYVLYKYEYMTEN